VEEHRQMDTARCEEMILSLQPGLRRGDPKTVEAAIKVLGHKSKLLGLEAPKRMEMTGKDNGPLTIELFRQLCDAAEKEDDGKEVGK
jgi:hypothetical protein